MTGDTVYFLLVDDLEENLFSLEELLRRDGLVMLKARSGPAALELLLKYDVALALLDVQMPGMNGFELAELIRSVKRTRHVPIIFLTAGVTDSQRRFRGYEAGAVDFLQKPIEPDIIRSKAEVFFDLYRQRRELENTLEENARLLEESRKYASALQDADRRKDEFLATLAHELRNPLAPISNGLNILRMLPEGAKAADTREMMKRQVAHLVRLIDDLLDVSRVSQGKIDLRKKPVTLKEIIQAAVETHKSFIEERKHKLVLEISDEELNLNADLTRLAQVIGNLLNNAAKYTLDGGTITLSAGREGDKAVVKVSDTGLGIPGAMLPRVFDMFTQIDRNLDRSQGGLGIGLALVKRLVDMHGGSIAVSSPGPELGSTFTLTLPLIQAPAAMAEKPAAAVTAAVTPLRVLVVDDNVESAKTIGWMLEMIGHQLEIAYDGKKVLAVAKSFNPDVILLDIGLPGMSGYKVCQELRKDPQFKDTVLIAQTGWGQEKDRQLSRAAGFDHHLTKPIDFNSFSALLGTIAAERMKARESQDSLPAVKIIHDKR